MSFIWNFLLEVCLIDLDDYFTVFTIHYICTKCQTRRKGKGRTSSTQCAQSIYYKKVQNAVILLQKLRQCSIKQFSWWYMQLQFLAVIRSGIYEAISWFGLPAYFSVRCKSILNKHDVKSVLQLIVILNYTIKSKHGGRHQSSQKAKSICLLQLFQPQNWNWKFWSTGRLTFMVHEGSPHLYTHQHISCIMFFQLPFEKPIYALYYYSYYLKVFLTLTILWVSRRVWWIDGRSCQRR